MNYRASRRENEDAYAALLRFFRKNKKDVIDCLHIAYAHEDSYKFFSNRQFYVVSIDWDGEDFRVKYKVHRLLSRLFTKRPTLKESYEISSIEKVKCRKSIYFENLTFVTMVDEPNIVFGFREESWGQFRSHFLLHGDDRVKSILASVPGEEHDVDFRRKFWEL